MPGHVRTALLAATAALLAASAAHAQPAIQFKSRELQEGRNYTQHLLAVVAAGESSGQASYRYDIAVPPAHGVTPEVALVYSSGAGASEVGYGWELTDPMIERSSAHGVPRYTYDDTFQYRNGHSITRLVPTGIRTSDGAVEYREESERSFSRYLLKGNSWTILRTNGRRLELGTTNLARRGRDVNAGVKGTAAWMVTLITDTHGNEAQYTYELSEINASRLRRIRYGGNSGSAPPLSIEFVWTPYWTSGVLPESYRSGYHRVFGYEHLTQIVVTAPPHDTGSNPATVPPGSPTTRTIYLDHGASTLNARNNGFYLKSARVESEPSVDFSYEIPWSAPSGLAESPVYVQGVSRTLPPDLGRTETKDDVSATRRTLVDVTGDGLPDIVDAKANCANNDYADSWTIWRNTGSSFVPEEWSVPHPTDDLLSDTIPNRCALRLTARDSVYDGTVQDFLDINGDSYPDLVYIDRVTDGAVVCPGTGSGFTHCAAAPGIKHRLRHQTTLDGIGVTVTDEDLLDFNGDGLADHIAVVGVGSTGIASVALGQATGGWSAPITITMPGCGYPFVTACLRATENVVGGPIMGTNTNRRMYAEMRDINGDGLPEFLTTGSTGHIIVYAGTGGDYSGSHRGLVGAPRPHRDRLEANA